MTIMMFGFPAGEGDFRGNNVRDPKWTDETVCHDWLVGCFCAVFDSETKLFLVDKIRAVLYIVR